MFASTRAATVRAAILTCCLIALSGCASVGGFPQDIVPAEQDVSDSQQYFTDATVDAYKAMTDADLRRADRDRIVYGRMHAYDVRYKQFLKALSEENGGVALGADFTSLALSGLGATVGNAATKAALAAASGGIIGAKGAISKDLFYEKALPAIVAQMEARRAQIRAIIEKGLAGSDADYSLMKALVDLDSYEMAGSLPGAVNSIVQDAGVKASDAEEAIRETRDATFVAAFQPMVAIRDRIKALTDAQALAVATAMEPVLSSRPANIQKFVNAIDHSSKRLTDGVAARKVLIAWDDRDRDPSVQNQFNTALDAATR